MANEFAIIEKYFLPLTEGNPSALSLKDDAALIDPKEDCQIVITKDVLVEGTHFFPGDDPKTLAKKALRVNLSDLAAMGASPTGYFLGLVLPRNVQETWIEQFTQGLKEDNHHFNVALLGGDTTTHEGGVIISITAFGSVPLGMAVKRSGAKLGDKIVVSDTLGDGALGLSILQGTLEVDLPAHKEYLLSRYYLPRPQVRLGEALRNLATSCIDVSDGLIQDLGHITDCSMVGAKIYADKIPLSDAAKALVDRQPQRIEAAMTGGDDYELLFTVPPAKEEELGLIAKKLGVVVTCIGAVTEGRGIVVYDAEHHPLQFKKAGYSHL